MRRSDSDFKQEIYRRYKHYKKSRRNLIILAATPILACVMIACALIFLPKLNGILKAPPIAEQPDGTTLGHIDNPKTPDKLIELDPSNPFYSAWETLKGTSVSRINLSTLPTPDETLARSYTDDESIAKIIDRLGKAMQTAGSEYDPTFGDKFSSYTFAIEIRGSLTSATEGENLPIGDASNTFELVGNYLREGNDGNWYEIDEAAAEALCDALLNTAPEVPEIDESHPFYHMLSNLRERPVLSIAVSVPETDHEHFIEDDPEKSAVLEALERLLSSNARAVENETVDRLNTLTYQITATSLFPPVSSDKIIAAIADYRFDIKAGKYLRYNDSLSDETSDWYEVDEEALQTLLVAAFGVRTIPTLPLLEQDNPFYEVWQTILTSAQYSFNVYDSLVINDSPARSYTAPYSINRFTTLLGELLQTAGSACKLDLPSDADGHTFELLSTREAQAPLGMADDIAHSFELVDGYIREGNDGVWYEIDESAAEALISETLPFVDALDLLDRLSKSDVSLKADVERNTPEYDMIHRFDSTAELTSILDALETIFRSDFAKADQAYVDSINSRENGVDYLALTILQEMHLSPEYDSMPVRNYLHVNLINGKYLRYRMEGSTASAWYEIDETAAQALLELLTGDPPSLPSITEDEVQAILNAGGYLYQLFERIDEPHRHGGSGIDGADLYEEWDLIDGRVLRIWLDPRTAEMSSLLSVRFLSYEFIDPSLPSITEDEMQALLDAGGDYHDLVALIGNPQRVVGSGLTIVAWDLADGRTLLVWAGLDENSRDVPIDHYEFWESPLAGLVELLDDCDVDSISVAPSPSDSWEGATSTFTDEASIAAITDKLISLTKYLSAGQLPLAVEDQEALNRRQSQYTTYTIHLGGNPCAETPDSAVPSVYLTQTIELLCIPDEGYYLRYEGYNSDIRMDLSDWVKVSGALAKELIELIDSQS